MATNHTETRRQKRHYIMSRDKIHSVSHFETREHPGDNVDFIRFPRRFVSSPILYHSPFRYIYFE